MRPVRALTCALAAILLSGCGPETPIQLDLRRVSITVPRLVTPAVQLVPAAPTPPPLSLPPLPPVIDFLPPVVATPSAAPSLPPAPRPACPKAGQFAVPAKPANLTFTRPPAPGTSDQQATGSFSSTTATGSLAGAVSTVLTAMPSVTTTLGQKVDAWRVERQERGRSSVELYRFVHPSTEPGATSGGIYLVGMAWTDAVRGDLSFQPVGDGLWILPVPVALAVNETQYAGAATDPDTLTTLSLVRNVTGRKRVDLCGQLVDTFSVSMTGTLTSPGLQRQLTWTQQLATAYGGADVEDTFSLTGLADGFLWTRSLRNIALPREVS